VQVTGVFAASFIGHSSVLILFLILRATDGVRALFRIEFVGGQSPAGYWVAASGCARAPPAANTQRLRSSLPRWNMPPRARRGDRRTL